MMDDSICGDGLDRKLSDLFNKSKINYEKKIYLNTFFVLSGN